MSYGNTLQTRLALDFDTAKFGAGVDPFGDLEDRLSKQSALIRDNTATVYTAVATSNVSTSTYFKNPVATVVSSLTSVLSTLYTTIWNYNYLDLYSEAVYPLQEYAPGLGDDLTALTQELATNDSNTDGTPKSFNSFISHSERLSNLKPSNKNTRPSFGSSISVLQTVQTLVYQTETTSTSTVGALGLGVFTSLFIESDLTSYWSTMTNDLVTLNTLLASNPTTVSSKLAAVVTSTKNNFTSLLNLVETRRTHDENFYKNATGVTQDLGKILSNKNAASTSSAVSSYLVDNLIGTEALKNL